MHTSSLTELSAMPMTWVQRQARSLVFKYLQQLKHGELVIQEGNQQQTFGVPSKDHLQATIQVQDAMFYTRLIQGGDVAAGESYFLGDWDSPDVTAVVQLMARNLDQLERFNGWLSKLSQWSNRAFHKLHQNSVKGSKKNIAAHYDLGNDFYRLFLDPSMMYSCAIFAPDQTDLHKAQLHKLDTICQRLELKPSERVIEIGTGWGGFAIYAAKHYGVHVTTTTISEEQYAYVKAQIQQEQLEDHITLLKQDYRSLEGRFDKLVSIEMIEAVGLKYLPKFFALCERLLKPNGKILIQAITIQAQRFEYYKNNTDFIQRYIFPGGFLPSVSVMNEIMARSTQLQVSGLHDIGLDYATTIRHWSQRLQRMKPQLETLGLDERFYRMWQYYFHYCEGGFKERSISTVHLVADKPKWS